MHPFQHVICGHSAVGSIKKTLGLSETDFVNMLDDLSVGPLTDVDATPATERVAFWFAVWHHPDMETYFQHGLAEVSQAFCALPNDLRPCLVWFGTGANEQMALYRVAHALQDSPREIWAAEAPLRGAKSAVGVCIPSTLQTMYSARRLLSPAERDEYVARWLALCAESRPETLRHFKAGKVETRPISSYDHYIRDATRRDWTVSARVVGQVMADIADAWPSDMFLYWRMREMTKAGLLEMEKLEAAMRGSKVRRAI
jgi:hypothetical protein